MDPLLIELCRRLARPRSAQAQWGQDLFFDNNPTYEEYLLFREGRMDLTPFSKDAFEVFMREREEKKKQQSHGQQNKG